MSIIDKIAIIKQIITAIVKVADVIINALDYVLKMEDLK